MNCTVELFGTPRQLIAAPEVKLELSTGATLRDLLAFLAQKEAGLLESVIAADKNALIQPYRFYREGNGFVDDLSQKIEHGDRFALMAAAVGG